MVRKRLHHSRCSSGKRAPSMPSIATIARDTTDNMAGVTSAARCQWDAASLAADDSKGIFLRRLETSHTRPAATRPATEALPTMTSRAALGNSVLWVTREIQQRYAPPTVSVTRNETPTTAPTRAILKATA